MESSETKILIGVPCYPGRVVTETIISYINAIRYHSLKFPKHTVDIEFRVRNFTTYAAERLCEHAMEKYDYLLFWGDDIIAPHDCIERLLAHRKDMVAAAVFARSSPFPFYAFEEDGKMFHVKRLGTGLQKCQAAGTGLMLIRSSVFKGMQKPWWIWPTDDATDVDREFCLKAARECGAEVWVDTNMEVGHLDFTPRVINAQTHIHYIESLKKSGILDSEEIKQHKDYQKLEALL